MNKKLASGFVAFVLITSQLPIQGDVLNGVVPDGGTTTSVTVNNPALPIIVNISAPNSQGTSLNTYTHFNVPSGGVVLNNSGASSLSQIVGGLISGNPNMGASAQTIINQVTSSNRSFLEGKLEVSGPKAHVLIANPNGIIVNGGQFINTAALTLTTGNISVNSSSGVLNRIGINTNTGTIEVGPLGLSGVMDTLNLVSKELKIGGLIRNQNTRVSSGVQAIIGNSTLTTSPDVLPGSLSQPYFETIPANGSGSTVTPPDQIVVDLDKLGGITSSKISIIVTDQGAGVRMDESKINARSDFELRADGWIQLKGAQILADGDITVEAPKLTFDNSDTNKAYELNSGQNIFLSSDLVELEGGLLHADEDLNFTLGISGLGDLITSAVVNGSNIDLASLEAKRNFILSGRDISITDAEINIGRESQVNASSLSLLSNYADKPTTWQSEDALVSLANDLDNTGAILNGSDSLSINARNIRNKNNIVNNSIAYLTSSAGTVDITADNEISNEGSVIRSVNDLTIQSNDLKNLDLNNQGSQIISTRGKVVGDFVNDILNRSSLIQGQTEINLEAGNKIRNEYKAGSPFKAILFSNAGDMNLKAGSAIENYSGRIISNAALTLEAPTIRNYVEQVPAVSRVYYERSGSRFLWKRRKIKGWRESFNPLASGSERPFILSNGNLTIKADDLLENTAGEIIANGGGNINIQTTDFINQALRVGEAYYEESCRFLCKSNGFSNIEILGGKVQADGILTINATNLIDNKGGSLLSIGDFNISSPSITNEGYYAYRFRKRYRGLKFWEYGGASQYPISVGGEIVSVLGKGIFNTPNSIINKSGLITSAEGIEVPNGIEEVGSRIYTAPPRQEGIGLFERVFNGLRIN
ncbi:MAG: filamentous hemagglutinin N-terminal domain-containing protein [Candidatus Melainabacteria bacterium]